MEKNKKRKETIKKFIIYNSLRILSLFVHKNEHIWLFGEFYGDKFTGNPKYFYLFLLELKILHIRPIWISNKTEIVNRIRQLKGEAYRTNSLKAIYYGLIAKVYIFSHSIEDIGNYAIRNALLINLWHGMPIKDIKKFLKIKSEKLSGFRKKKIDFIHKLTKYQSNGNYDIIIATSELTAKTFENAFARRPKQIRITGEPKNDIFFSKSKEKILSNYQLSHWSSKKIISYLPTFRDKNHPELSDIDFWNELNEYDKEIIILLHWHPSDILQNKYSHIESSFVYLANDLPIDVQELLLITDVLVTDYSSCFIDYLLLDRPIVFFTYDLEYYQQYRGFLYDFFQITPGEVTKSKQETAKAIMAYLQNPNKDKVKREKIKAIFHKYQSGGFSQNVFNAINELLKK